MGYIGKFERTRKGFGFIHIPELDEDIFIPSHKTMGAMNKDLVKVTVCKSKLDDKKREGQVEEIVERNTTKVVGVYRDKTNFGFVEVEDKKLCEDIFIPKRKKIGLKPLDGQLVVVEIEKYPIKNKKAEGKVVEILGFKGEEGVEILSIIRRFDINTEFNDHIKKEVQNIPKEVRAEDIKKRLDLREETIITIDGEDAKDLDDAISLKKLENGNYYLGVHIADVTHYVKEKSHLDKEAYSRGTSVYLIDEVIPMLPKELSNGICSLHGNVDRLTLSCFMEINKQGKVVKSKVVETVINSTERMTYSDVNKIVKGEDEGLINKYSHIYDMLMLMKELQAILYKKRMTRGSIDFEFKETKIELDEKRKPINIYAYERDIANRIIEELMLVCNETIAEIMCKEGIPFVYRIHDKPRIEKFETLNNFLISLNKEPITESQLNPKSLQKIVEEFKGKPEEQIINMLILRSLMKAKYSHYCVNHFGLNADYYCHFTSPIRRYPDLQIHRIIKKFINKELSSKQRTKLEKRVEYVSMQSSDREVIAQEAETEVYRTKKVEYMLDKIGEEFDATVSSVSRFGMYAELENTVDGLITLESFEDDLYTFNEDKFQLVGMSTEKVYTIGDKIRIKVKDADLEKKENYFVLVSDEKNV